MEIPSCTRQTSLASEDAPANFAVASADVLGRALGLFSEVRSGLREQVVLERLEGARHRHTAFLALHKGSEPLGDLDRVTRGRLHRVEELGRVSRLKEDARLARLQAALHEGMIATGTVGIGRVAMRADHVGEGGTDLLVRRAAAGDERRDRGRPRQHQSKTIGK